MRDRFENVDLLRAFAATAVVVYHVIELTHWKTFPNEGPLLTFRIGWIGVDLFFVISGFVITGSALALYRKDQDKFYGNYWTRRVSRIVPLYVLTGALWLALFERSFFNQSSGHWIGQLAAHLSFTHTFWPATFDSIDGVNWTLGVEMQFYLAVALLIPWLARTAGWRIWVYCILIAWTYRATMFYAFGQTDSYHLFMRVTQLPGTLDEFGAGIFLAKMLQGRHGPKATFGWAWVAAAIVLGTACMGLFWPHAGYWDQPAMVIFWRTSLGAFFLCVVAAAVNLPSFAEKWPLRPVHYVGKVSYGIYLWHLFAIELCLGIHGIKPSQALALTLGVTLLLASVSWHFFEKPILEFGRRMSDPKARPLGPASAGTR